MFHATLLTPYHENNIHGPNETPPTPVIIEGEEEYEVEGIINHRIRDGLKQYLVKWKDTPHSDNEWIEEEELSRNAEELLLDYKKANHLPHHHKPKITKETNTQDTPPQRKRPLRKPKKRNRNLN